MCASCDTFADDDHSAYADAAFFDYWDDREAQEEGEELPWLCGSCGSTDPYALPAVGPEGDPCLECLEAESFLRALQ